VSLEHVADLSKGDVLRSLCSFQRSLRRLSRGFRTTVSQNSTTCELAAELESSEYFGGQPSPVDVPGESGVSIPVIPREHTAFS
jgi:hypothetical protein